MTSTYTPGIEARKWLVELLRVDTVLVGATPPDVGEAGGLLYPEWSKKLDDDDHRVWSAGDKLPDNSAVREALPRILVEVLEEMHQREQRDARVAGVTILDGPVTLLVHHLCEEADEELARRIVARTTHVILSTQPSGARMIAAEFVPDGPLRDERVATFRNAWDVITRWRSENVGALA